MSPARSALVRSAGQTRTELGFTLVETLIALALLAAVLLATAIGLAHRGGNIAASRDAVVAFLILAKAHAATNGPASGGTGATVIAAYDATAQPPTTTLTLYDGRPFGGTSIARTPHVTPLLVAGQLALAGTSSGGAANANAPETFALFIGASGTTSALESYDVNRTVLTTEPACTYQTGILMPLTEGETSQTIEMSCATGEPVPN